MDRRLIEGDESAELSVRNDDNEDSNEAPHEDEAQDEDAAGAAGRQGYSRGSSRLRRRLRAMERRAEAGVEEHAALPAAAQNDEDDNDEEGSLLEQLMSRIRSFLSGEGLPDASVSEEQAQRLLEASAGDLDLASSLYWDDYFATIASRRDGRRPAEGNEGESPRRVRRRLEEPQENDEDMDQDEDAGEPPVDEAAEPPDVHHPEDPPADRRVAWADNVESVSVSDDEGPVGSGVRRQLRSSRRRNHRIRNVPVPVLRNMPLPDIAAPPGPPIRSISDTVDQLKEESAGPNDHKTTTNDDNGASDEDCLSDNDWIFEDEGTTSPVLPPVAVLWGAPPQASNSSRDSDDNNNDPPEAGVGGNLQNVVAEDDDGDDEAPAPQTGMPRTWVHAGFTMSSCGTGLIAKPPPDEEVSHFQWRQSQNYGSRNIAPPPYHCRGMTALLSVVTALMYSGASIQGTTVNCSAARTPFAELTEKERKSEFDSRLADALAALLLVAANASVKRKKRALAKRRPQEPAGTGDAETLRKQTLQRRLRLVPTCRWEDDTGTGDATFPEGQTIQIATSYTSIDEIPSYVLSTMRSFTKKGGCALFLETIIRIHGSTCVERMLRRSRRDVSKPECNALIDCACEERQKKLQQQPPPTKASEALPLDHSCTSIELVSLLLTGEVRSSFHGWSAGDLGIGILSNKRGEIGRQLRRPETPVWILRGDTSYSLVWLDGCKEESSIIAKLDPPETVFRLAHWQCWFGERHKSGLRVITARGKWEPPTLSKMASVDDTKKGGIVEGILERRRTEHQSPVVSCDEQGEEEETNGESVITREEIDRVKVHPDDEQLYPNKYRQWRFDMGRSPADMSDDLKLGPVGGEKEHWTPHFRLNRRQQLIVEMKLSPKINHILWTRWPGATIDMFTPENEEPPEV